MTSFIIQITCVYLLQTITVCECSTLCLYDKREDSSVGVRLKTGEHKARRNSLRVSWRGKGRREVTFTEKWPISRPHTDFPKQ